MAGKPGRSGGARPGAGRKPNPPAVLTESASTSEARTFLLGVMNDPAADAKMRVDAAKALLRADTAAKAPGGKKEQAQEQALTAQRGTSWEDLLTPGVAQ